MLKFIGAIVVIVALTFFRAYTVQMNWEWFVLPLNVGEECLLKFDIPVTIYELE